MTFSVVLSFAGDCVLGSEENSRSKPDSFDSLIAEKGFSWPFFRLHQLFCPG